MLIGAAWLKNFSRSYMAKLKYIIVQQGRLELPRVGSVLEKHEDLKREHENVIAAGFLTINVGEPHIDYGLPTIKFGCYGSSVGLGIKSREQQDAELIHKLYNFNGS